MTYARFEEPSYHEPVPIVTDKVIEREEFVPRDGQGRPFGMIKEVEFDVIWDGGEWMPVSARIIDWDSHESYVVKLTDPDDAAQWSMLEKGFYHEKLNEVDAEDLE